MKCSTLETKLAQSNETIKSLVLTFFNLSLFFSKEDSKALIEEKKISAALLSVSLKKLNRLEKIRTKNLREELHQKKQLVDSYELQLQNLLYELMYLKKEVTKCLQFK